MTKEFKPNDGQLKVIDHKEGPLLVVAGAGTGKTFVIIEKIKKLLADGVKPVSILAVTFTEKAAAEMLDRLLEQQTGLQLDIPIMTFNGFGETILREFGSHIGIGRSFRLLGEQAQIVFFRERIDEFKLDYFLPLTNLPDSIISDILKLFSAAKQHLITPADYKNYAESLEGHDEISRLDKKQQMELARAYEIYEQLCRAENVIDYDDQIYLVVSLLEARPNIKQKLQQRFHTIFIDEFQDTNPMQSRLVDMLVNEKQNLIVVGDDDQSIYGFRGATLRNILDFKNRYPNASEAALTENYRSGQKILDTAYNLIQNNNPDRLEESLKINKKLTSKNLGKAPVVEHFEQLEDEILWIAENIKKRIEDGEAAGDIAVLTRRRQTAHLIHDALEQAEVPHQLIGYSEDLYAQPIVRMMIELARTLAEPDNNNSLHHTLSSSIFNVPNELVAPYAAKARYEHEVLEDLLLSNSDNTQLVTSISLLRNLREQASSTSVGRLLFEALEKSGYKDKLFAAAKDDAEAAAQVQVLSQYFKTLKDFEKVANQPSVSEYLVNLPALKAAGENVDDTMQISSDEVNVLTVHKSKGLEWNTVYLPDCTEQSFPLRKMPEGLTLPASLKADTSSQADEHYAEERRLMYVAVTRAKENLLLTYSDNRAQNKTKRKPSRFLREMFGEPELDSVKIHETNSPNQQVLEFDLPVVTNEIAIPNSIFDGEKVHLSVSQAASLINCPLDFYYKFILRAPESPTPSTSYGTVLHGLIEQINKSLLPDGESVELEQLKRELAANWNKAGYASKQQERRAFAQANSTLERIFNSRLGARIPKYIEEPFTAELLDEGVVLRGRFDVAFDDENGTEIRDYKSGTKVNDDEKAKKRAQSSIQLTMYALAWQVTHGKLPDNLTLDFIDTGFIGSVKKTERGITTLRGKLAVAATHVRNHDFPLGSQHDYCIHP